MKIPSECDLCGSKTIEGDYGEAWWICSNKKCRKNDPNWSFKDTFEKFRHEYDKLNTEIEKLRNIKMDKYNFEIILDEARWIYDGSGTMKVKSDNEEKEFEFYIKNNEVKYITENIEILKLINTENFYSRIQKIQSLTQQRNNIFIKKSNE